MTALAYQTGDNFGSHLNLPALPELPRVDPPSLQLPTLPGVSQPAPIPPVSDTVPSLHAHLDGAIKYARARTPPAVAEARSRPRLSIDELNQMDTGELKEKYLDTGPDDARTPVQKVMDIIDLPRNTNANILFGHPTIKGVVGSYAAAGGTGAVSGGLIGGVVGGVGAGLASGGLAIIPGAIAGASEGAALGGAGGFAATGVTQAASAVGRGLGTGAGADDITKGKESGAAGQPRIFMSDALTNMGVNNRVANALLGFAGDTVMDPYTWTGESGWGAKAGELALGPTAKKVLQTGIKQAAAGGVESVADEATRNLLIKAAKIAPDVRDAGQIGKAVQGDVNKGLMSRAFKMIGEGDHSTGGVFEKYLYAAKDTTDVADHEAIDAVKDWVATHAAPQGVKIGDASQQIIHLPFGGLGPIPEWSLSIPGITPGSQRTKALFQWAKDKAVFDLTDYPHLADAHASVQSLEGLTDAFDAYVHGSDNPNGSHTPGYYEQKSALEKAIEDAPGGRDDVAQTALRNLDEDFKKRLVDHGEAIDKGVADVRDQLTKFASDPSAVKNFQSNPNNLLALGEMERRARAAQFRFRAEADRWAGAKGDLTSIVSDANGKAVRANETIERILGHQEIGSRGVHIGKTQVQDMPLDPSLANDFIPPSELAGAMHWDAYAQKAEVLRKQIAEAKAAKLPTLPDLQFELAMLRSKGKFDFPSAKSAGGESFGGVREYLKSDATGQIVLNHDPLVQATAMERAIPILDRMDEAIGEIHKLVQGAKVRGEDLALGSKPLFVADEAQSATDAARYADLSRQVQADREALQQATAPLREGPFINHPDWLEQLRQNAMKAHDESHQALFDLYGKDPKAAEALADSYSKIADAIMRQRALIGGTLAPLMSREMGNVVSLVKRSIGIDDDQIALSMIGKMSSALSTIETNPNGAYKFFDALDRQYRHLFGSRHGFAAAQMARIRSRAQGANEQAAHYAAVNFDRPIRAAIGDLGLTGDQLENAQVLASMELQNAYNIRAKNADRIAFSAHYVDENGNKVESPLFTRMEELRQSIRNAAHGDDTKAEQFFEVIKGVANKAMDDFSEIGNSEFKDGILHYLLPDYVPLIAGPTAKGGIRSVKGLPGQPSRGNYAAEPTQGAQRHRMSAYYMFPDVRPGREGKFESFIEGDRWVSDMSEQAIERLALENPEVAKEIQETKESIERYDRMPQAPAPYTLDIPSMNKVVGQGRFSVYGQDSLTPFFEERLPILAAQRIAMHERAEAAQDWLALGAQHSLSIDGEKFKTIASAAAKGGQGEMTLPNGEKVSVYHVNSRFGKGTTPVMYARGKTWRALDPEMLKYKDNPIISGMTKGLENTVLLEPVADFIEEMANVWKDDNISPMLRVMDQATSVMKATQLLGPSWFIKSIIGHVSLLAQGKVNMATWARMLPVSARLVRFQDNPEQLAKILATIRGQKMDPSAIIEAARQGHIIGPGSNVAADHLRKQGMAERNSMLPSHTQNLSVAQGVSQDFNYRTAQWAAKNPKLKAAGYPLAAANVGMDRINRSMVQPFFNAYQQANDPVRLAGVLALMEDGHDAQSAIEQVRHAAYDYEASTNFERNYLRSVVPFAAWARNNLAYQVKMLFEEPKWANAYPKLKVALEEMLDGEQKVPDSMRPEWMQESLATQLGSDPNSRMALMLGNIAPQLEAGKLAQGLTGTEGLMDTAKFGLSQVNPLLAVPAELGAHQEFFTGRSIGADEGQGDMTAAEFLSDQVTPLSNYGPGGRVAQAFERGGASTGLTKAVAGGNIQEFDQARLETTKAREYRDRVENIRRAITMQERRGDQAASLRSRAKLLRVYREVMELGLEKHVQIPGWAKRTLESFQPQ